MRLTLLKINDLNLPVQSKKWFIFISVMETAVYASSEPSTIIASPVKYLSDKNFQATYQIIDAAIPVKV